MNSLEQCQLCPRACRANRASGQVGFCGQTATLKVARAALHMWEEPCISSTNGSGTVFFSGCTMRCVFCQNSSIATGSAGKEISVDRLSEIFLELQDKGAHNINLVTPSHFVPSIALALTKAKNQGLFIPIVYNTGSYETVDTLRIMDGLVDIYLPDFKYYASDLSERYSHAADYFEIATKALAEMFRQVGEPCFEEDRLMRGIIVRHLILPGCTKDSKKVLRFLYETYGNDIFISIMNQFTPTEALSAYPEINRKITQKEYDTVVNYAISLGIENGFIQEGDTASESFIPPFDLTGI